MTIWMVTEKKAGRVALLYQSYDHDDAFEHWKAACRQGSKAKLVGIEIQSMLKGDER